ncbi:ABC transporter ATP-binding protein [Roseovarius sp. 10]|jgi:branched-chain amino acid transport system ATP-binding protein|uniref:ABC transporter ATP-binding protein n=1 Tax=Roseovarius sp. 10 TaxID=3080563 RepID=UPI002953C045|nr:ABC transporter ATP-binding protein [Roseovarius sp. 10]MDV7200148.1 ABC transporter ATP-binding protein [Roseovarius sp. 10]
MLELKNVKAQYGKLPILHGVNLEVDKGEAVALVGRNGVGKTTTLRSIMGLMKKSSGTVTFNGTDISGMVANKIPATGIGYVPQGRGLFPNLTVFENLCIGLPGKPDEEMQEFVYSRFPRLAERADQAAGTLSGGEQQMLAISRCLVMRPKLLILDEPTEGIMPSLVALIRSEIQEINQQGVSILLVEQNIRMALKICTKIAIMEKGVVVHQGSSEELQNQPEIVHRYLGLSH